MNKILVVDDELILNLVGISLKEACKAHEIESVKQKSIKTYKKRQT